MTDPEQREHVVQVGDEERVSEAVLRAVGAVSGRPPVELPPIQESVDVDSLDRLFEPPHSISQLWFEYVDYEVTIEPGAVRVRELR